MPNFNLYLDEEIDKLVEDESNKLDITKVDVLVRIVRKHYEKNKE